MQEMLFEVEYEAFTAITSRTNGVDCAFQDRLGRMFNLWEVLRATTWEKGRYDPPGPILVRFSLRGLLAN